jgi:hypothetical protein
MNKIISFFKKIFKKSNIKQVNDGDGKCHQSNSSFSIFGFQDVEQTNTRKGE